MQRQNEQMHLMADWAKRYTGWAANQCLPFFARHGIDHENGGFYQVLSATGEPDRDSPRLCYAVARQIYSFALGAIRGWYPPGREIAVSGLEYLLDRWCSPDGKPGFVHSLTPQGAIIDGRRDAYDHAFVLLALAWAFRLTGDAQIRSVIDETLAFTDQTLADDEFGGWFENDVRTLPRRQNPQMHALEAMLALYDSTGDTAMLERAGVFARLGVERLLPQGEGAMLEFFDAKFVRTANIDKLLVEPGHHFEWTWLLGAAKLRGITLPELPDLMLWTVRNGFAENGLALDQLHQNLKVVQSSCRLWPQTERVKAHLTQYWLGDSHAAVAVNLGCDLLWTHYIDPAPSGGYVDRYDASGHITDPRIIPRTLYHVLCMIDELDRVAVREMQPEPCE